MASFQNKCLVIQGLWSQETNVRRRPWRHAVLFLSLSLYLRNPLLLISRSLINSYYLIGIMFACFQYATGWHKCHVIPQVDFCAFVLSSVQRHEISALLQTTAIFFLPFWIYPQLTYWHAIFETSHSMQSLGISHFSHKSVYKDNCDTSHSRPTKAFSQEPITVKKVIINITCT